jgi:hypothetical protein
MVYDYAGLTAIFLALAAWDFEKVQVQDTVFHRGIDLVPVDLSRQAKTPLVVAFFVLGVGEIEPFINNRFDVG